MNEKIFDNFDDELDAIRLSLYEETKGMTPREEVAYLNAKTKPVIQRYKFRMSNLKPITPRKRQAIVTV
ncbi:MAG: hypothetical protein IJ587_10790 [Synergistaceae bacterium]|nr:hypothetical protein [Synergistaceae bacterium]